MTSGVQDLSSLSARELLRLYREHLPAGACYFIAEGDARHSVITEIHVPTQSTMDGVTFGFFEKGFPPPEHAQKEIDHWHDRYPFTHHITSTSPEFQQKLSSHVRGRLLNLHALTGA